VQQAALQSRKRRKIFDAPKAAEARPWRIRRRRKESLDEGEEESAVTRPHGRLRGGNGRKLNRELNAISVGGWRAR